MRDHATHSGGHREVSLARAGFGILASVLLLLVLAACTSFPAPATPLPPAPTEAAVATAPGATMAPSATLAAAATTTPVETTASAATQTAPAATVAPTATLAATAVSNAPVQQLAADVKSKLSASGTFGYEGVNVLPLQPGPGGLQLWAVYSYGMRSFDPLRNHFVAIYAYGSSGWQELGRYELQCADYLDPQGVTQVQVEPSRIWLQVVAGAGAHSGCFDLLSFDGATITNVVNNTNSSPGAGEVRDLDGDGVPEVILNLTDPYVFCYACGLRIYQYDVLRWNGSQFAPVQLALLPQSGAEDLRKLNDRAVVLAQAGLWKDAQALIAQARAANGQDVTVLWNSILLTCPPRGTPRMSRQGRTRFLTAYSTATMRRR